MAATASRQCELEPRSWSHWLDELPYRALVWVGDSKHGTPLYMVAGSSEPPRKATGALKDALRIHGGRCYYCPNEGEVISAQLTVDHVDASARGGCDLLN